MTNEEFYKEVMEYSGKYSSFELKKFYTYYTEKKHFSSFKTFKLGGRLATWFSPKRAKVFKKKIKEVNETKTDFEKAFGHLGLKIKIIKGE